MAQESKDNNEQKEGQKTSRISNRGFASMTPEQQRQIASKGGQAAHKKGVAHEWTSEEARAAGRKGGQASKKGNRNENSTEAPQQTEAGADTTNTNTNSNTNNNPNPVTEEPDAAPKDEWSPQRQGMNPNRPT